jgi:manganese-transporting P-type ATPase
MEKAGLEGTKFQMTKNDNISKKNLKLKILKRYPFSSELKRMSTIVSFNSNEICLTKGAPEILKDMFIDIPNDYDEIYTNYTIKGFRVIALGNQ